MAKKLLAVAKKPNLTRRISELEHVIQSEGREIGRAMTYHSNRIGELENDINIHRIIMAGLLVIGGAMYVVLVKNIQSGKIRGL